MSVDDKTVRRIAHLARIAVADDEVAHLRGELNAMLAFVEQLEEVDVAGKDEEVAHLQGEINAVLAFVEQLSEVDVAGVEPMTSVTPMRMKSRADVITDGEKPDEIVKNAPAREDHFFVVPKVVE
jgi:aspartyl-tRNA(Asn)/glutamyl-tRNA(Gln) amidotransferase subunit C